MEPLACATRAVPTSSASVLVTMAGAASCASKRPTIVMLSQPPNIDLRLSVPHLPHELAGFRCDRCVVRACDSSATHCANGSAALTTPRSALPPPHAPYGARVVMEVVPAFASPPLAAAREWCSEVNELLSLDDHKLVVAEVSYSGGVLVIDVLPLVRSAAAYQAAPALERSLQRLAQRVHSADGLSLRGHRVHPPAGVRRWSDDFAIRAPLVVPSAAGLVALPQPTTQPRSSTAALMPTAAATHSAAQHSADPRMIGAAVTSALAVLLVLLVGGVRRLRRRWVASAATGAPAGTGLDRMVGVVMPRSYAAGVYGGVSKWEELDFVSKVAYSGAVSY